MTGAEVKKIHTALLKTKNNKVLVKSLKTKLNKKFGRVNCVSIEDVYFGDSGKGAIVAKFNNIMKKGKKLISLRYNGGGNAGHETFINGVAVVTHQLPMGVIKSGATAIMSRGMLIHPEDLLTEISQVAKTFGGKMPGELLIDERALLGLDTHRALEKALNFVTTGGQGSTGRGIATGYASLYLRVAVTIKDLMSANWEETFRSHYKLYEKLTAGFGKDFKLQNIEVAVYAAEKGVKRKVGSENEFIERLKAARSKIKKYVSNDIYTLLNETWKNTSIPLTLEGAQGSGLDPFHGVYPDTTASRPMSRNLNDSTYNVILPEQIPVRAAVMKTTYMSSVGRRKLPTQKDVEVEKWIQEAFDERGRSTGRLRDIYPVSIPLAQYFKKAAGFNFLAPTHLDASKKDVKIRVVSHYTHKKTGKEMEYLPYQDYLDNLIPHIIEFPGWDGEAIKKAKRVEDLPWEALVYLNFLTQTIAPISIATNGPDIKNFISFIN